MTDVLACAPGVSHEDHNIRRESAATLASFRRVALSRWLARLEVYGESIHPEARRPFGIEAPAVVITGPEIGPELAASAISVPVNRALRATDLFRCHYMPDGPSRPFLRGIHPEIFAGFVEHAWADEHGIMGVLQIHTREAHEDLADLERRGLLDYGGLCLVQHVHAASVDRSPWGPTIVTLERSSAISLDFAGLPLSRGSRVLRRLAEDDEEPDEGESPEPVRLLAPRAFPAPRATMQGGVDVAHGQVGTGNIAPNAVTQQFVAAPPGGFQNQSTTPVSVPGATFSVNVDPSEAPAVVWINVDTVIVAHNSTTVAANIGATLIVTRNGAEAARVSNFIANAPGGTTVVTPATMGGFDLAPAGNNVYQLKLARHPASVLGVAQVGSSKVGNLNLDEDVLVIFTGMRAKR